jgi:hypothetical protein
VGLNNLGPRVSAGFGMIIRVLFSALYAALRVLLALMVTGGRGESAKDVELLVLGHGGGGAGPAGDSSWAGAEGPACVGPARTDAAA